MELNKEVLDCMQALRRRLRTEQALDIRLSQSDAVAAMLGGSLQSNDAETRRLGQRLAELTDTVQGTGPSSSGQSPQTSGSVRVYRGQRVYA